MTDYERYQLEWMIDHGYSIGDLLENLIEHYCANQEDMTIGDAFDDWFDNVGFNGEIWACEDEWDDNENSVIDTIDDIEDYKEKYQNMKNIAYNAICLGQLDERYDKEDLICELGCDEEEYDEIMS